MWRRYAEGVDEIDLLCAAAPKPTLLMAGEHDEVFRIDDTRRLAEEVADFYQAAGAAERFEFFADRAGHCYSLAQARRFVQFMNRWLRRHPGRPVPELAEETFALDPYDELRCHPRHRRQHPDVAPRDRARALGAQRDRDGGRIRAAAAQIAGARAPVLSPRPWPGSRSRCGRMNGSRCCCGRSRGSSSRRPFLRRPRRRLRLSCTSTIRAAIVSSTGRACSPRPWSSWIGMPFALR